MNAHGPGWHPRHLTLLPELPVLRSQAANQPPTGTHRHPQAPADRQPGRQGDPHFGRADLVDREARRRLVASISRFLEPEQAAAAAGEVEVLESRWMGGAWCWTGLTRGWTQQPS